jgi:hypothetical protein
MAALRCEMSRETTGRIFREHQSSVSCFCWWSSRLVGVPQPRVGRNEWTVNNPLNQRSKGSHMTSARGNMCWCAAFLVRHCKQLLTTKLFEEHDASRLRILWRLKDRMRHVGARLWPLWQLARYMDQISRQLQGSDIRQHLPRAETATCDALKGG